MEGVGVVISNEPWNEYQLDDGKFLSLKTVLVDVTRAVNEKAPGRQPLYLVKTQIIVKVK